MRFTPAYRVSYNGEYYEAGEAFEIKSVDVAEMSIHGIVEESEEPAVEQEKQITEDAAPVQKRGRKKKS